MKKTLRVLYPQWQGGVNPDYVFGAQLMQHILPPSAEHEQVEIPVDKNFDKPLIKVDGIDGGDVLLNQMNAYRKILSEKKPDRLITIGGDCSVSQVPFDYLHGIYGSELGILWLDAHPDISDVSDSSHLHELVLGNLMGRSPDSPITQVSYPFQIGKLMMGGLIEEDLRPMDRAIKELGATIVSPEELEKGSEQVLDWINQNGIKYMTIHWDVDVLSPDAYRSTYSAQPYTRVEDFSAAVGRMKFGTIERLMRDISDLAEIVGLSIAEHMPYDAMNMRGVLSKMSLFH